MTTGEFLEALEPQQEKSLVFDYGKRVAPGYHVTEIKAAAVHSMDCGGKRNQWFETTLQVWAPEGTSNERHLGVGKFLSIYRRVAAGVPIAQEATLRVEYGDVGSPAISYLVASVEALGDEVVVKLEPPAVACKANARFVGNIPVLSTAAACCLPNSATACCT
jgi:hypothetical protein